MGNRKNSTKLSDDSHRNKGRNCCGRRKKKKRRQNNKYNNGLQSGMLVMPSDDDEEPEEGEKMEGKQIRKPLPKLKLKLKNFRKKNVEKKEEKKEKNPFAIKKENLFLKEEEEAVQSSFPDMSLFENEGVNAKNTTNTDAMISSKGGKENEIIKTEEELGDGPFYEGNMNNNEINVMFNDNNNDNNNECSFLLPQEKLELVETKQDNDWFNEYFGCINSEFNFGDDCLPVSPSRKNKKKEVVSTPMVDFLKDDETDEETEDENDDDGLITIFTAQNSQNKKLENYIPKCNILML